MLKSLYKPIDNGPLIVFRIFFGVVFVVESFGALFTGWVRTVVVEPQVNFTFIGFEWLQLLMGNYMYVHFALMGIVSVGVALGYKYRWSIISLTVLWGCVYFMQKTSYNNHYYLMWLIALMMCFLPANASHSIDAKQNPQIKTALMPQWCRLIFLVQISCVYIYATIAKFYPDWLDGTFTRNLFIHMKAPEMIRPLFQSHQFHIFIAYAGILYDGLIIPALLWKRTRIPAIIVSVIFHIFNSVTLHIGVFPYFALCFSIFFFPPEKIGALFLRRKYNFDTIEPANDASYKNVFQYFFIPYLALQILLPLRHHLFRGDVLWTEEGHRLSWRMMLRSRSGEARFKVVEKSTNEVLPFKNSDILTKKQIQRLNTPDMIWQMAQMIQQKFAEEGKEVAVYVRSSYVSINQKERKVLINQEVDLTQEKWSHFKRHDWILDENDETYNVRQNYKAPNLRMLKPQK